MNLCVCWREPHCNLSWFHSHSHHLIMSTKVPCFPHFDCVSLMEGSRCPCSPLSLVFSYVFVLKFKFNSKGFIGMTAYNTTLPKHVYTKCTSTININK